MTQITDELNIGDRIADRYEIVGIAGRGRMGAVYKCRHEVLGRIVAIKTFSLEKSNDDRSKRRFEREARLASRMEHPNLICVSDFGYTSKGDPYLVMDYVEGEQLFQILRRERNLRPSRCIELFIQLCDGLYHAHQRGVMHRDLKPANILVDRNEAGEESVKIVDLGIAKIIHGDPEDEAADQITTAGEVCGSPVYLSPEQCLNIELDNRTDIYSLGICLYECLTGVVPFQAATVYETLRMHVHDTPRLFREVAPQLEIPQALEMITLKCLAKIASDRYETMMQVKHALMRARAAQSESSISVLPPESLPRARNRKTSGHQLNPDMQRSGGRAAENAPVPGFEGTAEGVPPRGHTQSDLISSLRETHVETEGLGAASVLGAPPSAVPPAATQPTNQGSTQQGSTQQGPMQQGPMQQGPMQQGPMQQGPMQQAPVQQGPMQQGSMQQGPIPQGPTPQGQAPQNPAQQGSVPVSPVAAHIPVPFAQSASASAEIPIAYGQSAPTTSTPPLAYGVALPSSAPSVQGNAEQSQNISNARMPRLESPQLRPRESNPGSSKMLIAGSLLLLAGLGIGVAVSGLLGKEKAVHLQPSSGPSQTVSAPLTPLPVKNPVAKSATVKPTKGAHAVVPKKSAATQKAAVAKHKDNNSTTLSSSHKSPVRRSGTTHSGVTITRHPDGRVDVGDTETTYFPPQHSGGSAASYGDGDVSVRRHADGTVDVIDTSPTTRRHR